MGNFADGTLFCCTTAMVRGPVRGGGVCLQHAPAPATAIATFMLVAVTAILVVVTLQLQPPTKPRASREHAVLDRAQEGGEEGAPVVRKVSENAKWRHSSFSLLWYDLWYDFSNLLFFMELLAEREGFEPSVRYQRTHTFQACSLSRSDTSPGGAEVR